MVTPDTTAAEQALAAPAETDQTPPAVDAVPAEPQDVSTPSTEGAGATGAGAPRGPDPAAGTIDVGATREAMMEAFTSGNFTEGRRLETLLKSAAEKSQEPRAKSQEPEAKSPEGAAPVGEKPAGEDAPEGESATDETGDDAPPAEPAAGAPPPQGEASGKKDPNRYRFNHLSKEDQDAQRRIHALTTGGMSLEQANEFVFGKKGTTEPPAAGAAGEDLEPTAAALHPNAQAGQQIADLESEVATLEQQLDEAGANDGTFNADVATLTKKLAKAQARLESVKATEQSRQERAQEAHTAAQARSETVAVTKYPALADRQSPLWGLYRDLCLAAGSPTHPDHAQACGTKAAEFFADKAARTLGIAPAGQAPAKAAAPAATPAKPFQPKPASPTQQPPATRPAPGTKGSATPPPAKSAADKAREAQERAEAATSGRLSGAPRGPRTAIFLR